MGEPENPYQPPTAALPDSPPLQEGEPSLASRGQRLGGAMLDGVIMLALIMPLQWAAGMFDKWPNVQPSWSEQLLWNAIGFCILLLVQSYFWATRSQSIGKIAAGTKIVTLDGERASVGHIILRRVIPLTLLTAIPFVGQWLPSLDALLIFRKDRRCLHDHIAGTRVVRVR